MRAEPVGDPVGLPPRQVAAARPDPERIPGARGGRVGHGIGMGRHFRPSPRLGRPRRPRPARPRPASGSRAAAPQVAPVVRMSSTSSTVRPRRPGDRSGPERPAHEPGPLGPAQAAPGWASPTTRRSGRTSLQREPTRQPPSQRLGLVVAPRPLPPPVERDRHDAGILRSETDLGAGLDHQLGEPGGDPGVPLVLEPEAEVADRPLVRPQGDRPVEPERPPPALEAAPGPVGPRTQRHGAAAAGTARGLQQLPPAGPAKRRHVRLDAADRALPGEDQRVDRPAPRDPPAPEAIVLQTPRHVSRFPSDADDPHPTVERAPTRRRSEISPPPCGGGDRIANLHADLPHRQRLPQGPRWPVLRYGSRCSRDWFRSRASIDSAEARISSNCRIPGPPPADALRTGDGAGRRRRRSHAPSSSGC